MLLLISEYVNWLLYDEPIPSRIIDNEGLKHTHTHTIYTGAKSILYLLHLLQIGTERLNSIHEKKLEIKWKGKNRKFNWIRMCSMCSVRHSIDNTIAAN